MGLKRDEIYENESRPSAETARMFPLTSQLKQEPGVKHDKDKLRYDLIPTSVIKSLAARLTYGVTEYSDRNWERGMSWSRVYRAVIGHLIDWYNGEEIDIDSHKDPRCTDLVRNNGGTLHLSAAFTELAFLIEYQKTLAGTDDRVTDKETVIW